MSSTVLSLSVFTLSAALGASAFAAPTFEVTPSVLGGPTTPFLADKIDGGASALLTLDSSTNTIQGQGYVQFTSFSINNNALFPSTTGLNSTYELWLTFNYTTALVSGTFGSPGSLYDVQSLTFDFFGKEIDTPNSYVPAGVDPTVVPSVITSGSTLVQLIGSGVLDNTGPDSASINAAGGTSFNANTIFTLTAFGESFFTDPDPFYNHLFNSFTNTSAGFAASADGRNIALTQAVGSVDFAFAQVPEPGSLALLGSALTGLFFVTRRRKH